MNKKKLLKIYLIVMFILLPVALFFEATDPVPFSIIHSLDYIFWATAMAGIYGYCYGKIILTNQFWKLYLPFIVIWDLVVGYTEFKHDPDFSSPVLLSILMLLYLAIVLPEYIGLYLYAHKNENGT